MLLLATLFAALSTVVLAQLDPDQIPQACQTQCESLLMLGNTCMQEFSTDGTPPPSAVCICNGFTGLDVSGCTTCLGQSDPAVGQTVSGLSNYCTSLINMCTYECAFPTCANNNVPCQCNADYLQDVYNCASCNTVHHNTNQTSMADYTSLRDSCVNQGYSATPTATDPLPSPTGIDLPTGSVSHSATSTGTAATLTQATLTGTHTTTGRMSTSTGTSSGTAMPSLLGASSRLEVAPLGTVVWVLIIFGLSMM